MLLPPKKASVKRAKRPPQQEELMDIQLDEEEEEADSDVRIVGRNGERRQQARPKRAERAPAYAEVGTQRSHAWRLARTDGVAGCVLYVSFFACIFVWCVAR
jgi:hypothetical protein